MLSKLVYSRRAILGNGSHGTVFFAEEQDTGRAVALKVSRVSLNVVRSPLRHEARVLQLLQGHRAIPVLLGYTRRPHFEYMAIELLGPSVRRKVKSGRALSLGTVARVGEQMIVHRDLKPDNILTCCVDTERVVLVDFSIAHHTAVVQARSAAVSDGKSPLAFPAGTIQFCSLSAHIGAAPRPQDDLESLAYVLLSLYLGSLPWHIENPWRAEPEVYAESVSNAYSTKQALNNYALPIPIPLEIAHILESASHREDNGQFLSTITRLRSQCRDLAWSLGECDIDRDPLNWSPVPPPASLPSSDARFASDSKLLEHSLHPPNAPGAAHDDQESVHEYFTDSYFETLFDTWFPNYGRRLSLTLPSAQAEVLDGQLPAIAEIESFLPPLETS